MSFAALLLDLDGTLLDTAADFHHVLNTQLKREGYPEVSYAEIRKVVSHGARAMVGMGFNITESHPNFARLRQDFLDIYATHYAVKTCLFDGFAEVLSFCDSAGIPWGIITNKPSTFAEPLWRDLNLPYKLGCLVCPDHVQQAKPDPEPMHLAANIIGVNSADCLYIGDHERDIIAGKAANMKTAVANWGYFDDNDKPEHWGADFSLNNPRDIITLLK